MLMSDVGHAKPSLISLSWPSCRKIAGLLVTLSIPAISDMFVDASLMSLNQRRLVCFSRRRAKLISHSSPPLHTPPFPEPPLPLLLCPGAHSGGKSIPTLLAVSLTLSSSSMFIPGLYLSSSVVYVRCALR